MDQVQRLSSVIQLAIGVQVILSAAISLFILIVNQKIRSEIAFFKLDLLAKIEEKLDDYVNSKQFMLYSEGHAKEHLDLHSEITRLRDFRHMVDGNLRELSTKIENLISQIERLDNALEKRH